MQKYFYLNDLNKLSIALIYASREAKQKVTWYLPKEAVSEIISKTLSAYREKREHEIIDCIELFLKRS